MSHHLRKVRPVRGRRLRNATHEKSGRESDLEGAERIPSGIRSEAKTISSASARTGQFAHYRIYFYTTGVSYDYKRKNQAYVKNKKVVEEERRREEKSRFSGIWLDK